MPTDNSSREFIYTSKRLLQDLYKQHTAGKPGSSLEGIGAFGFLVEGQARKAQPDNEYWLVRQVTDAIRDNTGTLMQPGKYVRSSLSTTWGAVPFARENATVAWLEATTETEQGPIFVALCGSLPNLHGHIPVELRSGWFPSSAEGLSQIVRAFGRGNNDPRIFLRASDAELPALFHMAYGVARSPTASYRIGEQELEILFEVFYVHDNLMLEGIEYRRAFFGTPLWAATPEPVAIDIGADRPDPAPFQEPVKRAPPRSRIAWPFSKARHRG